MKFRNVRQTVNFCIYFAVLFLVTSVAQANPVRESPALPSAPGPTQFWVLLVNNLHVAGPLTGTHPIFFAQTVTSDAVLEPAYDVIFEANNTITLQAGFHAKAGGTFLAHIVPLCGSDSEAQVILNDHLGSGN